MTNFDNNQFIKNDAKENELNNNNRREKHEIISPNILSILLINQKRIFKIQKLLEKPIQIYFQMKNSNTENLKCVWWNSSLLNWSSKGCSTKHNSTYTICECFNLSYFAVIKESSSENHNFMVIKLLFCF